VTVYVSVLVAVCDVVSCYTWHVASQLWFSWNRTPDQVCMQIYTRKHVLQTRSCIFSTLI